MSSPMGTAPMLVVTAIAPVVMVMLVWWPGKGQRLVGDEPKDDTRKNLKM